MTTMVNSVVISYKTKYIFNNMPSPPMYLSEKVNLHIHKINAQEITVMILIIVKIYKYPRYLSTKEEINCETI